ncbi:hypothetical protein Ga0102493_111955 [Erythrobacter litoralis]|uniref:Uncharacterized protein n=1 Tax=Erythrobacter litoralis TaxID=39960 RepID=A0A074ME89_9SPHN|nr:hypothetical protein [Erythrobacter litoralis]AOL22975.1 hypothetical protein Ga0102493_111955 [Erythrobacter litoralis]KEO93156.1 hypothetical protein EH32_13100 [Erythrobacter litoralis]
MKGALALGLLAAFCAACKPPPTDETLTRSAPESEPSFASTPLPSPETEGAVWAPSDRAEERIVYGVPGEPALIALACDAGAGTLSITRISPADEGAQAMFALVGNGHVGRLPVDATEAGNRRIWQGTHDAQSEEWEPLSGPRRLIATLPGAGTVEINPSPLPMELIERCRSKSG